MNEKTINEMHKFVETFWWHVGKKFLVLDLVKQYFSKFPIKMLEIGCGAGSITFALQEYGEIYANDVSKKALNFCESRGIKNLIHGDITKLESADFKTKFDLVLALDVLEHIQDDVEAINKVYSLIKKNGYFFVNVPSYKFLWSSHDEALEHKRRYTTYEITKKLEDAGFEIIKKSHFVFFAFPVIAPIKFLSNFFSRKAYPTTSYMTLPSFINRVMALVLVLETFLMRYVRLPFGTTITVVARKKR